MQKESNGQLHGIANTKLSIVKVMLGILEREYRPNELQFQWYSEIPIFVTRFANVKQIQFPKF